MDLEFNKIFGFFLKQKGIIAKFKKTDYGYRTYDNKWKLFKASASIMNIKPAKVYNGYDYDNGIEETKFQILQKVDKISIAFVYTKLI